MSINWKSFWDLEYWFEGVAGSSSQTPVLSHTDDFFWFFLYAFSTLMIFGIILRIAQAFLHDNHPLQMKLPFWGNSLITMGLLGLTWFTLRQLSVGFFGARFWLLGIFFWALYLAFVVIKYLATFYKLEVNYFRKNYLENKS